MAVLSDQKVPVADDPENMSLLLPSLPYTAMLGDSQWTQAQIAGMKTAEFVRETGTLPTAYGMTAKLDQQMPVTVRVPDPDLHRRLPAPVGRGGRDPAAAAARRESGRLHVHRFHGRPGADHRGI